MPFLLRFCLAVMVAAFLLAPLAEAQVTVRAPFTQVEVGPGQVKVQAPFTRIQVSVSPQPPPPPPPPIVVMPPPAGGQALSIGDFAATFKPLPGTYDVLLVHPFTQQIVKVCFTLPHTVGYYRTRVRPRFIEFDAPDHAVEIRFLRNGRVEIDKY